MGDTDIDAIMRLMTNGGMDRFIEQYVTEYVDNTPKELTEEEKQEQRREKFGKMSCPFDGYEDTTEDEVDTLMDLDALGGMDEEEGTANGCNSIGGPTFDEYLRDGYYNDYRSERTRERDRQERVRRAVRDVGRDYWTSDDDAFM